MPPLEPTPHDRLKADGVLLGATLGWGLTFAVVKDALGFLSPNVYLTARFVIATLAAVALAGGRVRHGPSIRYGALLGLMLWAGFVLNTWGLRFTSATRAGFVTSLCVVLVPLLGATCFRQRLPASSYVGAIIATLGLTLMSAPMLFADDGGVTLLGDALTVGSAVVYAFQILYTGRFAPQVRVAEAVSVQMAVVALLSAASLPFEDLRFELNARVIGSLLFTGLFASALFLYLQMWAQARTTAVRAALIFSLEPLSAAVFAHLLLQDPLVPETLQGGGLILLGILTAELWPRLEGRRAAGAEPAR